ncbi:MAG: hypothetical protein L0Z50_40530 [Verrucomicrobiales bacterium]|nr:hypothetical protein [Verrucomicrobiales bacterium]
MSDTAQSNLERSTRFGGPRGGNILEFYAREFKAEPLPADLFRQHVSQWFFAAKILRIFESFNLTHKPSEDDLASHRMVCSALITFGEFASNFARNEEEMNLNSVGLSVENIEAETRLLRDNFRMFHDDTMSCDEAEEIMGEVFQ